MYRRMEYFIDQRKDQKLIYYGKEVLFLKISSKQKVQGLDFVHEIWNV